MYLGCIVAGPDLQPGTIVSGKYKIERKLGQGGMGAVYAAHHQALGIRVALKVLLPAVSKDPQFVIRFLQEARAAARIQGEHVARVSDVGTLGDGIPFMVMEVLEGEDLSTVLDRARVVDSGLAVAYVVQALSGVAEAHELGVVHRDLKPSNLFVVRRAGRAEKVKVLDFGISKSGFDKQSGQITTTGATIGSPAYMSPEQVRSSKNVDARADIWSIGVILYELCTGRLPFDGDSVGGVFAAILETDPRSPHEVLPAVPETVSDIVMRCLRRDPKERIQTASELIAALSPFAAPLPVTAGAAPVSLPDLPAAAAELNATILSPLTPPDGAPSTGVQTQATWGDGPSSTARRRGRRSLWIAGVVGAGLPLVLGVVWIAVFGGTTATTKTPLVQPPTLIQPTVAPPSVSTAPPALSSAPSVVQKPTPPAVSTASVAPKSTGKPPPPKPSASTDDETRLFHQK